MQESSKQLKEANANSNVEANFKRFCEAQKIKPAALVTYKYILTVAIMLGLFIGLVSVYSPSLLKQVIPCAAIILCAAIPMTLNRKK